MGQHLTEKVLLVAMTGAVVVCAGAPAWGQEDFVPEGETNVTEQPTAWTRFKGDYAVNMGVEPWVVRGELGVFDYLLVGLSYGGVSVFGTAEPQMYPRPGFQARFRITNGGTWMPAVAAGYDDQGHGQYFDYDPYALRTRHRQVDYDRYQFKGKGFYAVASQEIEFLGVLGLHGGVSYNLIEDKDDDDVDCFGALEKGIGPYLMLLVSYDAALNDNEEASLGMGYGYLDAGIRWRVSEQFNLEFWANNVLENQTEKLGTAGAYGRKLSITYAGSF